MEQTKKIDNTRCYWIDNAKVIGLYLMILGHLSLLPPLHTQIIYSFHMPLFFYLSGLLFKSSNNYRQLFIKGINRLIVPYFLINTILLVLDIVCNALIANSNWGVKPRLLAIFLGMGYGLDGITPVCAPSWFLVSLFFIQLIACLIVKKKGLVWMVCGSAIIANVFIHYIGLKVISPVSFIMGLPFFCIGFKLKEKSVHDSGYQKLQKYTRLRRIVLIGLLLVATVMLSIYNGRVELCKVDYGRSITVFYVNALIGIGIISLLGRVIGSVFTSFLT